MNNIKPISIGMPLVYESYFEFDTIKILNKAREFSSSFNNFVDREETLMLGDSTTTSWEKQHGPHTWPELDEFNYWAGWQASKILKSWDYDFDGIAVTGSWLNCSKKGGWTNFHVHHGTHLVMAAYVSAPDGSGNLKIIDPCENHWIGYPTPLHEKIQKGVEIECLTNKVIFFAPFLRHGTGVNHSNEDRWVISMNFTAVNNHGNQIISIPHQH